MKKVLVTNAGGRLGVAVSRALISAPEPFYVIGADAHELQLHRSVAHQKHLIPRADEADYVPVLRSLIDDTEPDFLWVNHEAELALVSRGGHQLGVTTFLPCYESVAICQDKMAFNLRLQQAGVPAPQSLLIETEDDLAWAFQELGPDLWLRATRGTGGKGSLPVSDLVTATRWIDLHRGWGRFMAAPRLTPHSVTWESVWHQGELVAAQGRRRLYWEFSSMTFSGVTGMSGAYHWVNDPVVSRVGLQAVKAIDSRARGIFSVDMTYDSRGLPQVTEINAGRFMSGGIICHVTPDYNIPDLVVRTALGEQPSDGLPLLDRLGPGTIVVRGADTEPVFVDAQAVEHCAEELQSRRSALASGSAVGRARSHAG